MRIAPTTSAPIPDVQPLGGSLTLIPQNEIPTETDRIVEYFVRCGVLRPENPVTRHVRRIFSVPPEALRVTSIARRLGMSRRTLGRRFQSEGVPPPAAWVALARAVLAHRSVLRGRPLADAATAAGHSDQFGMSNAIHRVTGLRPSRLREVNRDGLLSVWIDRQRERGKLTGPPPLPPRTCPLCGRVQAD